MYFPSFFADLAVASAVFFAASLEASVAIATLLRRFLACPGGVATPEPPSAGDRPVFRCAEARRCAGGGVEGGATAVGFGGALPSSIALNSSRVDIRRALGGMMMMMLVLLLLFFFLPSFQFPVSIRLRFLLLSFLLYLRFTVNVSPLMIACYI